CARFGAVAGPSLDVW
nr:immunoglobulin heavy chain junction region [Macaca mulatta]MOW87556.1 immunoglobulin heavy chain junction region [Macaca mulatta]MOW88125.1 immunoglobulin heavy chain junction region [Macaca mulatta]MOW88144.1 immunoglobulin heavy chain junction region [Macaca mulatta]MOW91009.1 immunoglobulin heavy chain junction region [Macaca mulatta]